MLKEDVIPLYWKLFGMTAGSYIVYIIIIDQAFKKIIVDPIV
jgi:hypothetical protein